MTPQPSPDDIPDARAEIERLAEMPGASEYVFRFEAARARVIDAVELALGEPLGSPRVNRARIHSVVNEALVARMRGELDELGYLEPGEPTPAVVALAEEMHQRHVVLALFERRIEELEIMSEYEPDAFVALLDRRLEECGLTLSAVLPALACIGVQGQVGPFSAHPLWEQLLARLETPPPGGT